MDAKERFYKLEDKIKPQLINVYYVEELKHNLILVSVSCDMKDWRLFSHVLIAKLWMKIEIFGISDGV